MIRKKVNIINNHVNPTTEKIIDMINMTIIWNSITNLKISTQIKRNLILIIINNCLKSHLILKKLTIIKNTITKISRNIALNIKIK